MPKSVDWKNLRKQAHDLVVAEQKVSYEFLRERLGVIGVETVKKLLEYLASKNIVRRGKQRRWMVIVNADGTAKPADQVPAKKRMKKIRRKQPSKQSAPSSKKVSKASPEKPAVTPKPAKASLTVNGAKVTHAEKLGLALKLARALGGRRGEVFSAIADDLEILESNRALIDALNS